LQAARFHASLIMTSMQNFVKREGASQNGKNVDPDRQARAAKAKFQIKASRPSTAQESKRDQAPSGIPSRGLGHTQNTSATIQQAPAWRQPGPNIKNDPYDTDVESIDTTMNASAVQVEDSQKRDARYQQQDQTRDQIEDFGGASDDNEEVSGDEEEEQDEEQDEGEDDGDEAGLILTEWEVQYLSQMNMHHLSKAEAVAFVRQHAPRDLRTVDGDSYPTTTEGDFNDWEGMQEPLSEDLDGGGSVSPSPQRHATNGRPSLAPPQPARPRTFDLGRNHNMRKPQDIFQQSANIRGQQRVNNHIIPGPVLGHQQQALHLPSSQPLSYSQANQVVPAAPVNHKLHQPGHVAFAQPQQHAPRQPSGPVRGSVQPPKPVIAPAPIKRSSPAPQTIVPVIQQQEVNQEPVEEFTRLPADYDLDTLLTMEYNALKNESFDKNPRALDQPLPEDQLQKPLDKRLDFAQKSLDLAKQAAFFQSLPTNEWEDAGDWFLEQFGDIIKRTKEARQKKRKFAQEFEREVEKRYKHVAKMQRQVEDAMSKMKAQGEGLVASTPRAGKSPKPKRG
jgi:hypothetical protein